MGICYDVPRLYQLWAAGEYRDVICAELGIPEGSFHHHIAYHKLPKRPRPKARTTRTPLKRDRIDSAGNGFEPRVDPTPEEIAERALWIRENIWTQERRDGAKPGVSEIPCYSWSPSRKRYSTVS